MPALPPLLGHERALAPLLKAAREGRQHHALLLQGPDGVGKRTAALRLALVGICDHSEPDERPCGVCKACTDALHPEHLHPDVAFLEPDPKKASRVIDVGSVRKMVGTAGLARWRGRFRTWIVDPADAMNPAAQNALLKTLEEPNAGTGFILVTSRPQTLLPTIRSRCLQIRLTPVATEAIVEWLATRGVDTQRAAAAARLAEGRPGRALALCEDGVLEARLAMRDDLLAALAGSAQALFDHGAAIGKAGRQEARDVLDVVEEVLRDVVVHASASDPEARALHPDLSDRMARLVTVLWPDGVARASDAVQDARRALDLNVSPRAVMDALMMRVAAELGPARKALVER